MKTLSKLILSVFAIALTGLGQLAWAGPIGTDVVLGSESRDHTQARIETLLAVDNIADELARYGVEQDRIEERLGTMTSAELLALEGRIGEMTAGEGVLGLVGAVFVILLILEIVGVTDIFKSV